MVHSFDLVAGVGAVGLRRGNDCSFLKDPDEFTVNAKRRQASDLRSRGEVSTASRSGIDRRRTVEAATIARKNFIDDSIFGRMAAAGIQSAPLASDVEFLRRVTLDLTGRIPSGADVVRFIERSQSVQT